MPLLKAVGRGIGIAIVVPMIFLAVLFSALIGHTGAADVSRSRKRARRERGARERAAREAEDIDHDEND